jgi:hypothetical protein
MVLAGSRTRSSAYTKAACFPSHPQDVYHPDTATKSRVRPAAGKPETFQFRSHAGRGLLGCSASSA